MGRTILSGRAVASFLAPVASAINMPPLYLALFERTRSSNVHPSVPRWDCIWFGHQRDSRAVLVQLSEACAGGMLCSESGRMSPKGNWREWRKALQAPGLLRNTTFQIDGERGVNLEVVQSIMDKHSACTATLGATAVNLEMPGHAAALAEMFARSTETGLCPYRVFSHSSSFGQPQPGPMLAGDEFMATDQARLQQIETVQKSVQIWKLPMTSRMKENLRQGCYVDRDHVLVTPSGISLTGWAYSTTQAFMRDMVRQAETSAPGVAYAMLAAFDKKLLQAQDLPLDAKLSLRADTSIDTNKAYYRGVFEQIASALGEPALNRTAMAEMDVTVGEIVAAEMTHELGCLAPDQLCFPTLAHPDSMHTLSHATLLAA